MKIIVDMMGGDNAPLAVLEGAAQAVSTRRVTRAARACPRAGARGARAMLR